MVWKRNVGICLMGIPFLVMIGALGGLFVMTISMLMGTGGENFGAMFSAFAISALLSLIAIPCGAVLASRNTVSFSLAEAMKKGWHVFVARIGLWIGMFVFTLAVSLVFSVAQIFLLNDNGQPINNLLYYSVYILSFVINLLLSFGTMRVAILAARGQTYHFGDLFREYRLFGKWFLTSLLLGIVVFFAMFLFIFPGVYLAYKYLYVSYILAEKNVPFAQAFSMSSAMTKGAKMDLFAYSLVSMGLVILSMLLLGLGMFVAMPYVAVVNAVIYVMLEQRSQKL